MEPNFQAQGRKHWSEDSSCHWKEVFLNWSYDRKKYESLGDTVMSFK